MPLASTPFWFDIAAEVDGRCTGAACLGSLDVLVGFMVFLGGTVVIAFTAPLFRRNLLG